MKIIKEREKKEETYYTYDFDRNDGGGFTFPCNSIGEVQLNGCNRENYEFCVKNKSDFAWHGIVEHRNTYYESAVGECTCGEKVILEAQYMGACQCPKCGKWYNIFGQALLDPEFWEDDYN